VAKPTDVLWPRSRHTEAKHQLLIGYLDAWIGILGSWAEHVLLVDGFAGPGEYSDNEPGSPTLMLDAFLRRKDRAKLKPVFHFLFIEQNPERYEHLSALIAKRTLVPGKTDVDVVCGDFAAVFPSKLDAIRSRLGDVPPTFAFIDPFGAGDDAAPLASNLVSLPRCEALVYVPITHLARFVDSPDMETTLDRLYDGPTWRPACAFGDVQTRKQMLQDAFIARLKASCRYVRPFEIVPEVGKNSYVLFFGTNHEMGLRRMKDAMWKIDPAGGAVFRDSSTVDHPVLFETKPDLTRLEVELSLRFAKDPFGIETAAHFTLTETAFRDNGHLKPALKAAEAEGRIGLVAAKQGRKAGQFPGGTVLRFA
jgi:three-Cys-motif partner protein